MLHLPNQISSGSNFKTDPAVRTTVLDGSDLIYSTLHLPDHLSYATDLSKAIKTVEKFRGSNNFSNRITAGEPEDKVIEDFAWNHGQLDDRQLEVFEDYREALKVEVCADDRINRYSAFLMELIDQGSIHNYLYIGEGGYGKVILTFDYSKTPTKATIIKLGKNPKQRVGGVGNLIEEAEGQRQFFDFYSQYSQSHSNDFVKVCVPELYCDDSGNNPSNISSIPEQGHLAMEYTNGETIESLLYISQNLPDIFSDMKNIIISLESEGDNYVVNNIIKKFERMGLDHNLAKNGTIVRLLNKSDIVYILNKKGVKVSGKENKEKFTKENLKNALNALFSINGESLNNPEALCSEVYKEYELFLSEAKKQGLEHQDLNTSNIMIDYKQGKVMLWLIDFGTTAKIV